MTASCATVPQGDQPVPPRLILPETVTQACELVVLKENATWADLEVAYLQRGEALVACDSARQIAVETLLEERRLQDEWLNWKTYKRQLLPSR